MMNPIKFTFAFLKLALLAFTVSVPCHGDVAIQKSAAEIQRNLFDELEMRTDRLPTWDECEWAWSDLEIAPAHQMLFESGHPRPGEGIRIAHIDTGVIPFPLLKRQQDSSKKSAGLNYSTSLPSNPLEINSPFTIGSCPAVKTSFPACFAGMYAATGFGIGGNDNPSDSNLVS